MEILKLLYFSSVIITIFSRTTKFYWATVILAVILHSFYFFGFQGIFFLLVAATVSTIAELVSLKSRYKVFGVGYRYNLSSHFFPSKIIIAGVYPLDVTAAWVLLKYISFLLTSIIFLPFAINPIAKAALASFALVSFDFLIDPIAVKFGAWKWQRSWIFFGIPWQNFLGWFLVGLVTSLLFTHLTPKVIDPVMIIPVLIVISFFPLTMGKALISKNKVMGTLANIPIIIFLLLGVISLFY